MKKIWKIGTISKNGSNEKDAQVRPTMQGRYPKDGYNAQKCSHLQNYNLFNQCPDGEDGAILARLQRYL